MTYTDNNIYELTQVHRGKVVWNTIVPFAWTIEWDTVAWVSVSLLAGLLQPGLESNLAWSLPICRKSMDSVDIVHGHYPAGVLEWRSMDNVHWVHGHCPLSPWTMSTQSLNFFPRFLLHFIEYRIIAIQPNLMHTSSSQCITCSQCITFIFHLNFMIYNAYMYMSINTDRHTVFRPSV